MRQTGHWKGKDALTPETLSICSREFFLDMTKIYVDFTIGREL
jgi:hypothetical protein